jgi:hypothetical protein
MKKNCLILTAFLASQNICFAEHPKDEVARHPLDSLVTCIIDKHEDIVKNLKTQVHWDNPKAIYTLAKQCKATVENVQKVLRSLNQEKALCPDQNHIKEYVQHRLISLMKEPFENNKVIEGTDSFENIEFSTKFLVSGDPTIKYDPSSDQKYQICPMTTDCFGNIIMNAQQKEIMQTQMTSFRHHAEGGNSPSYFAKDKLHCAYKFKVNAEGLIKSQAFSFGSGSTPQQGIIQENPLVGYVILDKPVDYHLFSD